MAAILAGGPEFVQRLQEFSAAKATADNALAKLADAQAIVARAEQKERQADERLAALDKREAAIDKREARELARRKVLEELL
jgi:hypothetical protein